MEKQGRAGSVRLKGSFRKNHDLRKKHEGEAKSIMKKSDTCC